MALLRGAPLDYLCDDLLGLVRRALSGFVLETFDEVRGIMPCVRFELMQQDPFGLVGRHPRDSLELTLLVGDKLLIACRLRRHVGFFLFERICASGEVLFDLVDLGRPVRHGACLGGERLFEAGDLLLSLPGLLLGGSDQLMGLFLCREHKLLLLRFGTAPGVTEDAFGLLLGAANGLSGDPPSGNVPDQKDDAAGQEGEDDGGDVRQELAHARRPDGHSGQPTTKSVRSTQPGAECERAPRCRVGRSYEPAGSRWSR